jgi:hypothetical protein
MLSWRGFAKKRWRLWIGSASGLGVLAYGMRPILKSIAYSNDTIKIRELVKQTTRIIRIAHSTTSLSLDAF